MRRRNALRLLGYVVAWAVVAVPVALWLFVHTSQDTVLASHDASLRPTLDGKATLHLGPFLPDVRADTGGIVGADIQLGKTEAASTEELVKRYAFIASKPDAQVHKAERAIREVALRSALRGALIGLLPLGVWLLVGTSRRGELGSRLRSRRGIAVIVGGAVVLVGVWQPWQRREPTVEAGHGWIRLGDLAPDGSLPKEAARLQVRADLTTSGTRKLILSAVDSYDRSRTFYRAAATAAADLTLRLPEQGQTVALLVSDRHDNIGMDQVARTIADQAGATVIIDAGDDTSTGSEWEAFSLDSLDDTFHDLAERFAISGNHDNGAFVSKYLSDQGWTHLTGDVVVGPGDSRLMGVDDPRSSGFGTWRDVKGLTFAEQTTLIADSACKADATGDRVSTLVVHDANSGKQALARGCVDLVLSGHLHVQIGPTKVVGGNGKTGYTYTNGTTGGAAYAIAVGSKLRRDAGMTLVTYGDGRPVGVQPVKLRTDGVFEVAPFTALDFEE